jgi:flagellar biosynthesis protein FliR
MEFAPLVAFGILLIRIGVMIAMTPLFGGAWAPAQVKIGLTAILAIVILPLVTLPPISSPAALTLIVVHEVVVGLALSFGIRILVSAAELAGYLIGFQVGFAYAGIVDPQSGVRNNVLAVMYGTLTLLAILGANIHHQILRLLVATFEAVPVSPTIAVNESLVRSVMRMTGVVFTLGVQLAAPVVLVLLLVEVVMGVVTRVAPTLNLMVIGAPLRLLVGLFALGVAIQIVPGVVIRMSEWSLELASQLALAFR